MKKITQKKRLKNAFKKVVLLISVSTSLFFIQGCNVDAGIVPPWELPNWDIAWSEKFKGTQIQEMVAVDMIMDDEGSTYTLGQMNLIDGTRWATLLKYNRFGVKEAQQVFQSVGDDRTLPRAMAKDKNGDIVVVGERQAAGDWFVTKMNGTTLNIIWDVNRLVGGKNGSPYTVSVGDSGTVYVAGNWDNWNRYATAFFDGATGANIYEQTRTCCSNGTVNDTEVWDSLVYYDADGKEWFMTTYPGFNGSTSSPGDIAVRYYRNDAGIISDYEYSAFGGLDSTSSDYDLMMHPDGYILFAGNDGDYTDVFRIDYGTTGITSVSTILTFEKAFRFRAMTVDSLGSLYITGDTINHDSPDNTNAYIAKYDAGCVADFTYLCWDHTFNHTMLFNVSVSLLGKEVISSFTREEVRDVFISNNFVYILTSSETSDAVVTSKRVTELIGFSKGSGDAANQIQIKASDSVAAQVNPYDPTRVHVVGVNVNADLTADPDIYLYTHAVHGF